MPAQVEWLQSSFAPVDLSNPKPSSTPGLVSVELYQSRADLAELRGRFPTEFAASTELSAEGATQALIDAERVRLATRARVDPAASAA